MLWVRLQLCESRVTELPQLRARCHAEGHTGGGSGPKEPTHTRLVALRSPRGGPASDTCLGSSPSGPPGDLSGLGAWKDHGPQDPESLLPARGHRPREPPLHRACWLHASQDASPGSAPARGDQPRRQARTRFCSLHGTLGAWGWGDFLVRPRLGCARGAWPGWGPLGGWDGCTHLQHNAPTRSPRALKTSFLMCNSGCVNMQR